MHEFIHRDDEHVQDAFQRFKKAHNKSYRDKAAHEKRKHNFRQNLRLVALSLILVAELDIATDLFFMSYRALILECIFSSCTAKVKSKNGASFIFLNKGAVMGRCSFRHQ